MKICLIVKVEVFILTFVCLYMFSKACLYEGPYFRRIVGDVRLYHLPLIFVGILVLLFLGWIVFKRKRKLIKAITLMLLLVYVFALYGISEVKGPGATELTKKNVLSYFGYREENFISDNDLKMNYVYIEEISPKAFNKIGEIEYIFVPDNIEIKDTLSFKEKPALRNNDFGEVRHEIAYQKSAHCLNTYIILHNKYDSHVVKVVKGTFVSYKNRIVNRIFARGDRRDYYDHFSSAALLVIVLIMIAICWGVSEFLPKIIELWYEKSISDTGEEQQD